MVNEIRVKSILNKHKKRDDWFLDDYSLSPYQSCPFNCLYCYIRGSKYGTNMAKTFFLKVNAPELLEKELSRRAKKNQYGIIYLAGVEPYLKQELELKMIRKMLEIILKYKFPVHLQTKSVFIERDFDLLKKIDEEAILPSDLKEKLKRGAIISFSFSSLDENLRKILEPGAYPVKERLETMKKCRENGFLTGAAFIPVLPFLSDSEEKLEEMIKTAKDYEADFVLVGGLTLFGNGPTDCKTLYYQFLEKYYPQLVPKYKSLFRIFFAPSKEYQKELEEKSKKLSEKYKVKYGIL
ncbi:MAG TPA: radical SAM protein [Elusimicrobia bacterium]|jgi:DNA repair photolyase|nr:radical SAM protein [Elusimicrobiota bacterium]